MSTRNSSWLWTYMIFTVTCILVRTLSRYSLGGLFWDWPGLWFMPAILICAFMRTTNTIILSYTSCVLWFGIQDSHSCCLSISGYVILFFPPLKSSSLPEHPETITFYFHITSSSTWYYQLMITKTYFFFHFWSSRHENLRRKITYSLKTKRGERRAFKKKAVKKKAVKGMLRGKTQKLALWCLLYQEMITTEQREQLPSVGTRITIEKKGAKNIKGNVPIGKQN